MMFLGDERTIEELKELLEEKHKQIKVQEEILEKKKKEADKIAEVIALNLRFIDMNKDLEWADREVGNMRIRRKDRQQIGTI